MRHASNRRLLLCLLSTWLVLLAGQGAGAQTPATPAPTTPAASDEYSDRIQPIFESRCIACHSCYNAPCQLNLQAYSGAARGATPLNVYDARRLHSTPPTRPDIDAKTTEGWRDKGFHDVLGAGKADASILLRLTKLRASSAALQPEKPVAESQICLANADSRIENENQAALGMPYGLPPLSSPDIAALQTWLARGAPPPKSASQPERAAIPAPLLGEVASWETFLNEPSPRQQLVSRYVYEHLFLAHLHFASSTTASASPAAAPKRPPFFRLVRSRTACETGIDEIATRRPSDPPGTPAMFYCLRPYTAAIVEKTHLPYELSPAKLARIKSLFLGTDWSIRRERSTAEDQANNPFETYDAIPVKARYQFLLDDAQYHVATFIKGPVCNGTEAVNSIQEQFFVFFLKPEADSMVMLPKYAEAAARQLVLPGVWGSDVDMLKDLPFLKRLVDYRETYRRMRAESVRTLRENGYALDDIWDGDGSNPNALLTVFRHDDNAAVFKGAIGDLSKTVFVLDYPLLERLVYNLVVNFDVFGNVGHQVLTRVYMDLIRMEAEELFLSFLPIPSRQPLRKDWYAGGLLTDVKLNLVFPLTNQSLPTSVQFRNKSARKLELVQRLIFERLPAAVRGPADPINWRVLSAPRGVASSAPPTSTERSLQRMASVYALKGTPFSRYFPDLAFLLVNRKDGGPQLYSIVHNREHANVSWIMGEKLRLAPYQDTLTIREGLLGAYPNMFFEVDEKQVDAFASQAAAIRSAAAYDRLVEKFGVTRTSDRFWQVWDTINEIRIRTQPIEGGVLDLTRYALDEQ